MNKKTFVIVLPILLFWAASGVGCQGLTNGQMGWIQTASSEKRAGNVYLERGLIGVFSTGMDELGKKISDAGVRAHVYQDAQHSELALALAKAYKNARDPEPLVLIGHSYGADDVLTICHVLQTYGVTVDLLITVDATVPPTVPSNVKQTLNYYQSAATDFIPMFRGIPLKQDLPAGGPLVNWNLRKDRSDLLVAGLNHINIDKDPLLHADVVRHVLEACPPREVWAAKHSSAGPAVFSAPVRPPQ